MKAGGTGGARTGTGLYFEKKNALKDALSKSPGYSVHGNEVRFGEIPIASLLARDALYSKYLTPQGVAWDSVLSAKLLPDEALLVTDKRRLHILELKYQEVPGSVDEKLQTCAFKKRQYTRLMRAAAIEVTFSYVLNDWFLRPRYRDVLEYIRESGCRYYFNQVPLADLDLPSLETSER